MESEKEGDGMMPQSDFDPCVTEFANMYVSVHSRLNELTDDYEWSAFTIESFMQHCGDKLGIEIVLHPFVEHEGLADIAGYLHINDQIVLVFHDALTEPERGFVIIEAASRFLAGLPAMKASPETDENTEAADTETVLWLETYQRIRLRQHYLILFVQAILNRAMYGLASDELDGLI